VPSDEIPDDIVDLPNDPIEDLVEFKKWDRDEMERVT